MNICLVSGQYPPENGWGGIATYASLMANELSETGHRVFVVASQVPGCQPLMTRGTVEIHRVRATNAHYYIHRLHLGILDSPKVIKRLEYQIAVGRKMRELQRRCSLDVVEYADSYADGLFHRTFSDVPYVVKLHIPYWVLLEHYASENSPMIGRMERSFVRRADGVFSPCSYLADAVSMKYGISREDVEVVPNPIDCAAFAGIGERSREHPQVLFAGWHTALKGVDIIADAIPKVLSANPTVRFVFVGGDPFGEGGLKNVIMGRFKRERAENRVRFLDFIDDKSELAKLYRETLICVVPSRADNFPYVCLEAMASGCVVVASRVGGIPEIVQDGVTGILFDPGDVGQLSSALIALLAHPDLMALYGKAGQERVLRQYDTSVVVPKNCGFYRKVIERSRHGRSVLTHREQ